MTFKLNSPTCEFCEVRALTLVWPHVRCGQTCTPALVGIILFHTNTQSAICADGRLGICMEHPRHRPAQPVLTPRALTPCALLEAAHCIQVSAAPPPLPCSLASSTGCGPACIHMLHRGVLYTEHLHPCSAPASQRELTPCAMWLDTRTPSARCAGPGGTLRPGPHTV